MTQALEANLNQDLSNLEFSNRFEKVKQVSMLKSPGQDYKTSAVTLSHIY